MPNFLTKLILFMSSYLPLWLIFLVQLLTRQNKVGAILAGAAAMISILGLLLYLQLTKRLNPLPIKVVSINRRDGEAMSYIVSYLLPFIALPSSNTGDLLSLAIFIIVLAILYINSDMIHINPVLNLIRWHIYEVERENGYICTVLSKQKVRRGLEIRAAQIGEDLFIVT